MEESRAVARPSPGSLILREQVMPLLLESCPSFRPAWAEYTADPDFDAELLYLHLAEFNRHVLGLLDARATSELPAIFGVVERLHVEGERYVREAATIGLLEGLLDAPSLPHLERHFGAETARWWTRLQRLWDGDPAALAEGGGEA